MHRHIHLHKIHAGYPQTCHPTATFSALFIMYSEFHNCPQYTARCQILVLTQIIILQILAHIMLQIVVQSTISSSLDTNHYSISQGLHKARPYPVKKDIHHNLLKLIFASYDNLIAPHSININEFLLIKTQIILTLFPFTYPQPSHLFLLALFAFLVLVS